eukprot:3665347-Pyramimonas_sp.AAC.1
MNPTGEVDLHCDSGYQRLSGGADDDVKGYGIRGANLLRRANAPYCKPVVDLIGARCKSHRLQVRSSHSAETLAAAHNWEDCYPTIVTLHELHAGPLTPTQSKDILGLGGLSIKVTLTIDAETHQLDTTHDGAWNRARHPVKGHPRHDCGWSHQGGASTEKCSYKSWE